MLTPGKKAKLLGAMKLYKKQFLEGSITELDESGTRIMINNFLSQVLDYKPIEEIKTEYMIKGTYADYVIQVNKVRHFLVEVKALSFELSEKHLRQTINYGANEGIEYALLTNGKKFDFYKIIFDKPIDARRIFSLDLSDGSKLKESADYLQHLHKDSTVKNSFKSLWNRCEAVDPLNIAGMLQSDPVMNVLKKLIRTKYNEKCNEGDLLKAINQIIVEKLNPEMVRPFKLGKSKTTKLKKVAAGGPSLSELVVPESESRDTQQ